MVTAKEYDSGGNLLRIIIDGVQLESQTGDLAEEQRNRGRVWYNSTDRQVKAVVDDGAGGYNKVILG